MKEIFKNIGIIKNYIIMIKESLADIVLSKQWQSIFREKKTIKTIILFTKN